MHLQVLVIFSYVLLFSSTVWSFSTGSQYRGLKFAGRAHPPADRTTCDDGWLRQNHQGAPHLSQRQYAPGAIGHSTIEHAAGRASPTMQQRASPNLYRDPSSVAARQLRTSPMQGSWLSMQARQSPQMGRSIQARQSSPQMGRSIRARRSPQMDRSIRARGSPQMGRSMQARQSPQMGRSMQARGSPQMGRSMQARQSPQMARSMQARQSPQMGRSMQARQSPQMARSMQARQSPQMARSMQARQSPQMAGRNSFFGLEIGVMPPHHHWDYWSGRSLQGRASPMNYGTRSNYGQMMGRNLLASRSLPPHNKTSLPMDSEFPATQPNKTSSSMKIPMNLTADHVPKSMVSQPENSTHQQPLLPQNTTTDHGDDDYEYYDDDDDDDDDDNLINKILEDDFEEDEDEERLYKLLDSAGTIIKELRNTVSEHFQAHEDELEGAGNNETMEINVDGGKVKPETVVDKGNGKGGGPGGIDGGIPSSPGGGDTEDFEAWRDKCLGESKLIGRMIIDDHCTYEDYLKQKGNGEGGIPGGIDGNIDGELPSAPGGGDTEDFEAWRDKCLGESKFIGRMIIDDHCTYEDYLKQKGNGEGGIPGGIDGNIDGGLPSAPGGGDTEDFEAWRDKCLGESKFNGRMIIDDHCTYEDYLKQHPGSQSGTSPDDNSNGGHHGHDNDKKLTLIPGSRDSEEFKAWQDKCRESKFVGRRIIRRCSYEDYMIKLRGSRFGPGRTDNLEGGTDGGIPSKGQTSELIDPNPNEVDLNGQGSEGPAPGGSGQAPGPGGSGQDPAPGGSGQDPAPGGSGEGPAPGGSGQAPAGNDQTFPFELIAAQLQNKTKAEMTRILLDRHNAQPLYRQKMYLYAPE